MACEDVNSPAPETDVAVLACWFAASGGGHRGGGALVSALRPALMRDVEELTGRTGVEVDHVTVYRWVQRFTPLFADAARFARHSPGDRWSTG